MSKNFFEKDSISSDELVDLLEKRSADSIHFLLIDIRESEENRALSIVGTDVLFPISKIHMYPDVLEKLRHENVILYCRSGSRTAHLLAVMQRMGYEHVSHLVDGIIEYRGEMTNKKAPPIVY